MGVTTHEAGNDERRRYEKTIDDEELGPAGLGIKDRSARCEVIGKLENQKESGRKKEDAKDLAGSVHLSEKCAK